MRVSVIIPLHNGAKYIGECLSSLSLQSYKDFDTIVVDDGSVDSVVAICKNFGVTVVRTPRNIGYAGAVNYGMKRVDSDAFAFLNQDTRVDIFWLENMVQTVYQECADMVAPNVLDLRTYPRKLGAGCPIHFYPQMGTLYFGEIVRNCCLTNVVPGTGCLVTRRVLDELGLPYDERFFMYWEDVDLSIRAVEKDMNLVYQPAAVLWHRFHNPS